MESIPEYISMIIEKLESSKSLTEMTQYLNEDEKDSLY